MSSFLKQGKRNSNIKKKLKAKKHVKKFYKILEELDLVVQAMLKSGIIIKEDNVVQEAAKYTNKEIGNYEKMIILSKIDQVYTKVKKQLDEKSKS